MSMIKKYPIYGNVQQFFPNEKMQIQIKLQPSFLILRPYKKSQTHTYNSHKYNKNISYSI